MQFQLISRQDLEKPIHKQYLTLFNLSLISSFTPHLIEAGTDEVGRGCLAGPVVAAAVILPKDYHHPYLTDSKKLSALKREQLKVEIEKEAISYAVAEISNQEIDQINILNASIKAMHLAIDALNTKPELILVDGNRFKPFSFIPYHCIIKGDSKYFSIAAASILAKCYRDDLMLTLSKEYSNYGWKNNVGYPTLAHRKAIYQYGYSPWHRLSFKLKAE